MGGFGGGRDSGGSSGGGNARENYRTAQYTTSKTKTKTTNTGSGNGGGGPKPTIVDKIKNAASSYVTSRKKQMYSVANLVPGMKKGLVKNRTDYKDYLKERGNTPNFLNVDDDTLASFDTFEQVRNYEPTQRGPNSNTLNYADYLAEEKGNFNLKYAGNVGNSGNNNPADGMSNQYTPKGIELAKAATGSATILGPAEIQKTAANTSTIKMLAAQTNVANKRKGRNATKLTAKSGLNDNYTLSSKTLLG